LGFYVESVRSVSSEMELLLGAVRVRLPTPVRYCNMDRFNRNFSDTTLQFFYCARDVNLDPVHLARLPKGAILYGQDYLLRCDEVLVKEQLPWWLQNPASWPAIIANLVEVEAIGEPCILIARYGAGTWGHWLGELLPAIVACEHAHPKMFKYVLPAQITAHTEQRSYSTSVLESLAAYGVSDDRLIRVGTDRNYRFEALFVPTRVWSNGMIHPHAANLMRTMVKGVPISLLPRKVALTRPNGIGRSIVNSDEFEFRQSG
jgi:hypothetical protein